MQETLSPSQIAPILDALPDAVIWAKPVLDTNGAIKDFEVQYANSAANRLANHPEGTLTGMCLLRDGIPATQDAAVNLNHYLDVHTTGQTKTYTYRVPGANHDMELVCQKYHGGVLSITRYRGGQPEAVQKEHNASRTLQEITTQQEAAIILEQQNKLLDSILKHSPSGLTVLKAIRTETCDLQDLQCILTNNATEHQTQLTGSELLSKTILQISPELKRSPLFEKAETALKTGTPFQSRQHLAHQDRWLELSVAKMDEEHLIVVSTEITAIMEAQMQMENADTAFKAVFNSAQTGMFTLKPEYNGKGELTDFRFVMTNPTIAAYIGKKPEDLEGQLESRWFPGCYQNGAFDLFKQAFETGQSKRQEIHYKEDGLDKFLDVLCIKVGELVLVYFTDHTQLRQAQLQLEQSVEELKKVNANLEEFAYAASHDLKEPLRKINFFTDRLKAMLAGRLNADEQAIMERIEYSSRRMGLLVDDLLEYSHVSRGAAFFEAVDLNQKVRLVLEDLELIIQEKGGKVNIGTMPTINGHRRQLQQLFQNLFSNAIKYSKADVVPVISIDARQVNGKEAAHFIPTANPDKDYHLIEVADNGIGFEQEDAERIFNVFTRLHGKGEYAGTGVGLSIARKVVENHQGYIWATSAPGAGTTFHILLPQ